MINYSESKIKDYLAELASKKPAPGGGSVAALTGAIGIATLEKVVNFTVGKEKYKNSEKEMKELLAKCIKLRDDFNRLCTEDAVVYGKLREAFKMPKDSDEREKNVQKALKDAVDVPLQVCRKSCEAMSLCLPIVHSGNENLITDTEIASIMFMASFRSGLLNIEINFKSLKDKKFVDKLKGIIAEIEEGIVEASGRIQNAIKDKLKQKGD